jgi:hypothetical protein
MTKKNPRVPYKNLWKTVGSTKAIRGKQPSMKKHPVLAAIFKGGSGVYRPDEHRVVIDAKRGLWLFQTRRGY